MKSLIKIIKAQKTFEASYGSAVTIDQELVSKVSSGFEIQTKNASMLSMSSLNDRLVESQSEWNKFVAGYCFATGKIYGKSNYERHENLCRNFIENEFIEINSTYGF